MLKQHALNFPFTQNQDKVSWKWSLRGVFIVKSTYDRLTSDDNGESYSRIWKAKFPYKIKIFIWLIEQGAILTKDNVLRRKWVGDPSSSFVMIWNQQIIYFSLAILLKWPGALLLATLVLIIPLIP